MKTLCAVLLAGMLGVSAGCSDYLDVNTNPNSPQSVSANLYLPPMLHWMATGPQYDGRYIGRYAQEWDWPTDPVDAFERMGYYKSSDAAAEQWRDVYWLIGQGLVDMMNKAEAEQRWDLLGVGQVIKAWGWQVLTDMHGNIIVKEAFDPTRHTFDYDSQQYVYTVIDSLLNQAITNLQRTDGAVDPSYLARGDHMYNGDRTQWLKLAYGMLALNHNHYAPNKSSYNPQDVISLVDKSFQSEDDDAIFPYPAASADHADFNFWGQTRGNVQSYRQTQFIVHLMDGTEFGGAVDPRMSRMLAPSPDGQYRGLNIDDPTFGALPDSQIPNNFFGYPGTQRTGLPGRYIFSDKAEIPIMTYAELQFIKAEAEYYAGDKAAALAAYKNGIGAHIDFVNRTNTEDGQTPTQITAAQKDSFLTNPAVVPTDPNQLTLSAIMSQKYIALWGWGHNELWLDMRRYHYTDKDPSNASLEIFRGFALPTNLDGDNGGKPVQRVRPRYNSDYVWNQAGLRAIGGLDADYHTKRIWITCQTDDCSS